MAESWRNSLLHTTWQKHYGQTAFGSPTPAVPVERHSACWTQVDRWVSPSTCIHIFLSVCFLDLHHSRFHFIFFNKIVSYVHSVEFGKTVMLVMITFWVYLNTSKEKQIHSVCTCLDLNVSVIFVNTPWLKAVFMNTPCSNNNFNQKVNMKKQMLF